MDDDDEHELAHFKDQQELDREPSTIGGVHDQPSTAALVGTSGPARD